jgi:hypothetical protein
MARFSDPTVIAFDALKKGADNNPHHDQVRKVGLIELMSAPLTVVIICFHQLW